MEFHTTAVIGAGLMGGGIAQFFAEAGVPVLLNDMNEALVETGIDAIRERLTKSVARGKIPSRRAAEVMALITPVDNLSGLSEADFVIEAIVEDQAKKADLFGKLSHHIRPDAVLATNTSSLSVTALSEATTQPERFLGIHFFNPPTKLELVEVVPTPHTAKHVVDSACTALAACGKTPVQVKDSPGFIVNRLLLLLINEAARMVDEGVASAEDIDTAMRLAALHPAGPLTIADLIGLDTVTKILDTLGERMDATKYAPASSLTTAVNHGDLGRKSGKGFYDYTP
ncbi:MAG: 3-hydroxyacyl-CoA dehydrogenase family protein [Lentisphaerae bacterium]|jgi:3-hydroxybutyryl-CoA dehydrogenase|nr:3-hydroxyacyl-CoA dehydrogenase family protein [Lentisphaerota bacterium]MBT4815784.1 3-hydroxyacyl-CoA dehydrogenase family protein [Lentisphaerota bacterium]MBT5611829.1 3-hydroxyacyl-CoA dehydrogenase family protein [Lentisphaerota bacterium]MBT7059286.1 3-hydroxyacyl-CoA dehydrogenase family protein [Lentisphaerota bacterium]MBT7843809.1 3-hydroxyacyl-CoA dehydrogenase family protein [Lentisphaerota bacterium]